VTTQAHAHLATRSTRRPALIAVGLLMAFIALLPERYRFLPNAARVALLMLVVALAVASTMPPASPRKRRIASAGTVLLIVLLTLMLVASVVSVIRRIFEEGVKVHGAPVLSTTTALWAANIVVFALWYWLVDRGGPDRRASGDPRPPDLLFPQAQSEAPPHGWTPGFVDYVFVAFTASTAFSPTDTAPLTPRVKVLMMAQSVLSLATVVVMVGRAINVLE